MYKKYICMILLLLNMFAFSLSTQAHQGGTDSNGGHTDHSTGEYHYHHGYSAHQHDNGACPYDFDDNTQHNSNSNSNNTDSNTSNSYTNDVIIRDIIEGKHVEEIAKNKNLSTNEEDKITWKNVIQTILGIIALLIISGLVAIYPVAFFSEILSKLHVKSEKTKLYSLIIIHIVSTILFAYWFYKSL